MYEVPCWHIVISGFLQQRHSDLNGMVELWVKLHRAVGKHCPVMLKAWNDNFKDLADLIFRLRPRTHKVNSDPLVYIYAYSWGGASAVILAKELQRHGIPVHALVLSDAVYRHPYIWGQWRTLIPYTITLPRNIREVYWFIQKEPRISWRRASDGYDRFFEPAGHNLKFATKRNQYGIEAFEPKLHPPVLINTGRCHSSMDELMEFHDKCLDVALA